jgi:hypothetical protein
MPNVAAIIIVLASGQEQVSYIAPFLVGLIKALRVSNTLSYFLLISSAGRSQFPSSFCSKI